MSRRVLSGFTAICLLLSFFALPAEPTLVCRMTGKSMPVVVVAPTAPNADATCCTVESRLSPDEHEPFVLANPGCCDLHFTPLTCKPAAQLSHRADHYYGAWTASIPAVFLPRTEGVDRLCLTIAESSPRGPPLVSSSPRAPPFFS